MTSRTLLRTAVLALTTTSTLACVVTTDDASETANADTNSETPTETETETAGEDDLCMQSCAVAAECGGDVTLEDCVADCEQLLADLEAVPECIPPNEALIMCIAGLDCEGFTAYLGGDPSAPCVSEEQALGECGDPGCTLDIPGDADGCQVNYSCTGGAETYEIDCSFVDGCVCKLDGQEVGTCDQADLVCAPDPVMPYAAINDCCGWDLG